MKKIMDWLNKSRAKKITCSQVSELIANQEYQIGHPHVHISDGFELTFPKNTLLTLSQIASKAHVWGPTTHLHPAGSNPIPAVGRTNKKPKPGLFIDKNMLPESDKYLKRGRGKTPAVPYQAPVAETVYVTNPKTGEKIMDKKTGLQKTYQRIVQKAVKECLEIPAEIPHSMFEDGESAVMTLTAVLNSIAGAKALFQLMGNDKAVVFSHTAVDALHKFTKHMGVSAHTLRNKKIMMKEWRDLQGNGKFEAKSLDIDHVVTVLKKDGNKLILTTHYPCAEPMNGTPTQGVTTGRLDLLETDRDLFYGFRIDFPLPAINW